ncbi:MAG: hypothetical protein C4303_00605, partial [candidate division GAL15 bacterium]
MNVVVCIKQVPDTEQPIRVRPDGSGIEEQGLNWILNYYDEHAVRVLASRGLEVSRGAQETVLSQLAQIVFGGKNALYLLVQFATMLILVLAANTSFADFPRLASIMAKDGFMPRAFTFRGDRLAFTNGIL